MKTRDQHWFDLFSTRPTRRDFARISLGLGGVLALGGLPGCRADRGIRIFDDPFGLGVASGDPWPDGVVLWTRLVGAATAPGGSADGAPVSVRWEVARDDGFADVVQTGSTLAMPELGYSVHAEVEGLEPARDYWYRFDVGGQGSPVGRTRTAPALGARPETVRFAFASCQDYEAGLYTALRHLADEQVDLIIHLGDYIYEKTFASERVREHEAEEVFSLDDYRARYTTYRADPNLQAAHASAPWVVTPDDHEVDNNFAGAVAEDGQTREQLLLRRAAAFQAYYEFMPLRRAQLPSGPDMQLFRRLRLGSLMELHVLDTRQYRSDQPCGDGSQPPCEQARSPEQTMLGVEQEQWLQGGLAASGARWNVIANQVLVSQIDRMRDGEAVHSMDQWGGYRVERQRLLDFLGEVRPANPVVITGDIHSNWAVDLKRNFDDPASEVVGAEFVGTSLSSGGDGGDGTEREAEFRADNPHLHFFNGQRGYVRCSVTADRLTADFRVVPFVTRPDAPIGTRATFVVEDGRPGAQAG